MRLALRRVQDADVTTRWSSASVAGAPSDPLPSDPAWAGGSLYVDERRVTVEASPEALWRVIEAVGGERGWYSWALARQVRGLLDRVVGGPGLRPRAEMRLPGLAWLELRVEPGADDRRTVFAQRALFHPHGLAGQLYWWAVYPFHGVVFGGMQRGIAQAAATVERARTDR